MFGNAGLQLEAAQVNSPREAARGNFGKPVLSLVSSFGESAGEREYFVRRLAVLN